MNELTGITHPDSSTETLTYDNNGNLTQTTRSGEVTSYQWDCFDRMTKVTLPPQNGAEAGEEIVFTYNGEDELIKIDYLDMAVDMQESKGDFVRRTAKFKFNKQETPTEIEASTYNIFVRGELLCKYGNTPDAASTSRNDGKNTGEPRFYHYDHNGNTAIITDRFGNITDKILMDAYGNVLPFNGKNLYENLYLGIMDILYLLRTKLLFNNKIVYNSSFRNYIHKSDVYLDDSNNLIYSEEIFSSKSPDTINLFWNKVDPKYNEDVFGSMPYNDIRWMRNRKKLRNLLRKAGKLCPKINDYLLSFNGLGDYGTSRRLRFYISKDMKEANTMGITTNKLKLNIGYTYRNPSKYQFKINEKDWYNQTSLSLIASIIHEFVHISDDENISYQEYIKDFTTQMFKTGKERAARPCEIYNKGYTSFRVTTEYHAYFIEYMFLKKIGLTSKAQSVLKDWSLWRRGMNDKTCCIKDKYKEIRLSDYC